MANSLMVPTAAMYSNNTQTIILMWPSFIKQNCWPYKGQALYVLLPIAHSTTGSLHYPVMHKKFWESMLIKEKVTA